MNAPTAWTRDDLKDLIAEAISDSMDMDCQSSCGAESVLARLESEGLRIGRDLCKLVASEGLLSAKEGALDYSHSIGTHCSVQWGECEVGPDRHCASGVTIEDALAERERQMLAAEDARHDAKVDAADRADAMGDAS